MATYGHTHHPAWQPDREAGCPTCHRRAWFSYQGEQRWPLRVAQALGVEPVVRLWNCHHCRTTVSEDMLQWRRPGRALGGRERRTSSLRPAPPPA